MRRSRRPRRPVLSGAFAGWLFADLLLVLTMVALGSQADPLAAARPAAAPSPSPSHRPTANAKQHPHPHPTKAVGPRAVDRASVRFTVSGTDPKDVIRQLRSHTTKYSKRQAALVLTFGGGQDGESYAHKVNSLLTRARGSLFPRGTATRDYLILSARPGTAKLEVFFYTIPG